MAKASKSIAKKRGNFSLFGENAIAFVDFVGDQQYIALERRPSVVSACDGNY